jgi:hypothetical protein
VGVVETWLEDGFSHPRCSLAADARCGTLGAGPLASSLPPRDRTYRRMRPDGKGSEVGRKDVRDSVEV